MPLYKNVSKIGLVISDVGLVNPGEEFESTNEELDELRAIKRVVKAKKVTKKKVTKKKADDITVEASESDTGSDE